MPKNGGCHGNYKSVNYACLYTTDFQSHRKSNAYISHLNYVQLYETLHLEMAAHFQKVTETGPSLKQVLLRYQNARYDLTKKMTTNSLCFRSLIKKLQTFEILRWTR